MNNKNVFSLPNVFTRTLTRELARDVYRTTKTANNTLSVSIDSVCGQDFKAFPYSNSVWEVNKNICFEKTDIKNLIDLGCKVRRGRIYLKKFIFCRKYTAPAVFCHAVADRRYRTGYRNEYVAGTVSIYCKAGVFDILFHYLKIFLVLNIVIILLGLVISLLCILSCM